MAASRATDPKVSAIPKLNRHIGPHGYKLPDSRLEAMWSNVDDLTQWLMLRPNVQYVYQPGGTDKRTDDVILGLKVQMRM